MSRASAPCTGSGSIIGFALGAVFLLAAANVSASPIALSTDAQTALGYDDSGIKLFEMAFQGETVVSAEPLITSRGVLVNRRHLVDAEAGLLVATFQESSGLAAALGLALADANRPSRHVSPWSNIVPIMGGDGSDWGGGSNRPLLDSAGTAWVVSQRFGEEEDEIWVSRSADRAGNWSLPEMIYRGPEVRSLVWTIDANDNFTLVFRSIIDGTYVLSAIRFDPSVGVWSSAEEVYRDSLYFDQFDMEADALGNVVLSIGITGGKGKAVGLVYDSAVGTWGEPFNLSPPAVGDVSFPVLAASRDRTVIYSVFWVREAPGAGLLVRRFRPTSKDFGRTQLARGSTRAYISGSSGSKSYVPAAVDDSGNLTVVYYLSRPLPDDDELFVLRASRLVGGEWEQPATLDVHTKLEANLAAFSGIEASPTGDVFFTMTRSQRLDGEGRVTRRQVHRYDAASSAWDGRFSLTEDDTGLQTRTRVSVRQDGTATAVYQTYDEVTRVVTLASRDWTPAGWGDEVDVPGGLAAAFLELVSDTDTLLVFESDVPESVFGTWLRPAPN